jgi:hypothetical protein
VGSGGIFWLSKLRLIVLARFEASYVVITILGHLLHTQKRPLWVFIGEKQGKKKIFKSKKKKKINFFP